MQFGSDNQVGASRQILEMIETANSGFTHGYGDDQWCAEAAGALKDIFSRELEFFLFGDDATAYGLICSIKGTPIGFAVYFF